MGERKKSSYDFFHNSPILKQSKTSLLCYCVSILNELYIMYLFFFFSFSFLLFDSIILFCMYGSMTEWLRALKHEFDRVRPREAMRPAVKIANQCFNSIDFCRCFEAGPLIDNKSSG